MMMENHRNILLGSSVTICFHLQYHTVRGEGTSDKHLRYVSCSFALQKVYNKVRFYLIAAFNKKNHNILIRSLGLPSDDISNRNAGRQIMVNHFSLENTHWSTNGRQVIIDEYPFSFCVSPTLEEKHKTKNTNPLAYIEDILNLNDDDGKSQKYSSGIKCHDLFSPSISYRQGRRN
uniref:Uncharacterized protein n=1 Tax=Corethron hystrix TaxID=216773 RepID=A0A7S1BUK8_9STRA|mmetsp:Transcript_41722/g.97700  ORF Transcript_41722/g.97700 Transcript_41722/m.97700 type:complete len:176 (+) Transcript_41722:173-700(+)